MHKRKLPRSSDNSHKLARALVLIEDVLNKGSVPAFTCMCCESKLKYSHDDGKARTSASQEDKQWLGDLHAGNDLGPLHKDLPCTAHHSHHWLRDAQERRRQGLDTADGVAY
jgi:hypothetical protein